MNAIRARLKPRAVMIAASSALLIIGLVVIHASTAWRSGVYGSLVTRQLLWTAIGAGCAVGVWAVGYQRLVRAAPAIHAGMVALVALTLAAAPVRGAHRWLAPLRFAIQPSELAKVSLVLAVAWLMGRAPAERRSPSTVLGLWTVMVLGLMIPLVRQPDLSTALTCLAIGLAMLWALAPARWMPAAASLAALAAAPIVWRFVLHAYQRERVLGFLRGSDELGLGYQTAQTVLVTGSGGLAGQGTGSFGQALPYALADAHTDFAAAVWAHERGFAGVVLLLALYALVILSCLRTARTASKPQGAAVAFGVAALLLLQVAIHVGSCFAIIPVTGVNLPLISYGGSNLVATMVALGLVGSVDPD